MDPTTPFVRTSFVDPVILCRVSIVLAVRRPLTNHSLVTLSKYIVPYIAGS